MDDRVCCGCNITAMVDRNVGKNRIILNNYEMWGLVFFERGAVDEPMKGVHKVILPINKFFTMSRTLTLVSR